MILEFLYNLVSSVLHLLLSPLRIPSFGDDFGEMVSYVDSIFEYAVPLVDFFLPWEFVAHFIPVIIAISEFQHIYDLIMWILQKIPMIDID